MVYKRKAQVLFVGSGDGSRARIAAAIANDLGQDRMTARAVTLEPIVPTPEMQQALHALDLAAGPAAHVLDAADLAWADLLVTLDAAAARACADLPPWLQTRCYPVAAPESPAGLQRVYEAIRQRVAGMLGGMAMLAKSE